MMNKTTLQSTVDCIFAKVHKICQSIEASTGGICQSPIMKPIRIIRGQKKSHPCSSVDKNTSHPSVDAPGRQLIKELPRQAVVDPELVARVVGEKEVVGCGLP